MHTGAAPHGGIHIRPADVIDDDVM